MIKPCSILLLLLCSMPACAGESLMPESVISIYDGDTFTVNLAGCHPVFCQHISVRIAGIDTPEMRGKCASEIEKAKMARAFLAHYLRGDKRVELRNVVRDKYFRIRANVFVDGIDLGKEMIDYGFARPYDGGKRGGWCDK